MENLNWDGYDGVNENTRNTIGIANPNDPTGCYLRQDIIQPIKQLRHKHGALQDGMRQAKPTGPVFSMR